MIYCFDIDNTICKTKGSDYKKSVPYISRIIKINELYDDGNKIIIYTARGKTSGINWRKFTEKQLKKWGLKYHKLLLNKPEGDIFIDDKAINTKDFFNNGSVYRIEY